MTRQRLLEMLGRPWEKTGHRGKNPSIPLPILPHPHPFTLSLPRPSPFLPLFSPPSPSSPPTSSLLSNPWKFLETGRKRVNKLWMRRRRRSKTNSEKMRRNRISFSCCSCSDHVLRISHISTFFRSSFSYVYADIFRKYRIYINVGNLHVFES